MTLAGISGIRLDEPGVAAVAAMRAHGERRQRPVLRVDDDRAARAAAATSVIQNIERRRAVRFDGAGAIDLIRADENDARAGCAARLNAGCAESRRTALRGVVRCAGAAATAHDQSRRVRCVERAAESAARRCSVPRVAAAAAIAGVAAAATAGVLIVRDRIAVGSAAARIACCAARAAAVRITIDSRIENGRALIEQIARRAGDAFTFRCVRSIRSGRAVVGVCSGAAGELPSCAGAEAGAARAELRHRERASRCGRRRIRRQIQHRVAGDVHDAVVALTLNIDRVAGTNLRRERRAGAVDRLRSGCRRDCSGAVARSHRDGAADVHREHAADVSVPSRRACARGECRGRVLRNANHLEVALTLCRGRDRIRVRVDQSVADAGSSEVDGAARGCRHCIRRHDVFVSSGAVQIRRAAAGRSGSL